MAEKIFQKSVALIEVRAPWGAILKQTHLVRPDGEVIIRDWTNVSETVEEGEGESFLEAAIRGIKEELGLRIHPRRLQPHGVWEEVKPSPTTGKMTEYTFEGFRLNLAGEEPHKIKKVSIEDDGTEVHFKWDNSLIFEYVECLHCGATAPLNEANECSVCGGT